MERVPLNTQRPRMSDVASLLESQESEQSSSATMLILALAWGALASLLHETHVIQWRF